MLTLVHLLPSVYIPYNNTDIFQSYCHSTDLITDCSVTVPPLVDNLLYSHYPDWLPQDVFDPNTQTFRDMNKDNIKDIVLLNLAYTLKKYVPNSLFYRVMKIGAGSNDAAFSTVFADVQHEICCNIKQCNNDPSKIVGPLSNYSSFNEFFMGLRVFNRQSVTSTHQLSVAAESFASVVTMYWGKRADKAIKGVNYNLQMILGETYADKSAQFDESQMLIFRMTPCHAHIFVSPFDATIMSIVPINGRLNTVKSVPNNDKVFAENARVVIRMCTTDGVEIVYIAFAAIRVGDIAIKVAEWQSVSRYQAIGAFGYSASTIGVVIPTYSSCPGKQGYLQKLLTFTKFNMTVPNKHETYLNLGTTLGEVSLVRQTEADAPLDPPA